MTLAELGDDIRIDTEQGRNISSNNTKRQDGSKNSVAGTAAESGDDRSVAGQDTADISEHEPTVPILTLEDNALPGDGEDAGTNPYDTGKFDSTS